jgi:L-2-hydroxyglutarate oxidase LhgO
MEEVDILIIGAGVVGLAIAKEASQDGRNVLVAEKNRTFGQETSSRNSEVIHAGMYYPCGTLKAKLCVEGKELLYDLCAKQKISFKKIGKLIVAVGKEEIPSLEQIYEQGRANGVNELRMIEETELKEMEPNICGLLALYSPSTGILDSHRLMQYYEESAHTHGAIITYDSEVTDIQKLTDGYRVSIRNGKDTILLKSRVVINCAGLDSDKIAEMAGIDINKFKYKLFFCKGQYFRVNQKKARFIQRLVYPVPKPKSGGLGVHATLDLAGGLRLGPDDEYLNDRKKDYSVDESRRLDFYFSAKPFLPFLEEQDLSADTSGIRPKLQEPKGEFRDFIIQDETLKGLPGFINLIGIESPGLTASPAIARYVKELIKHYH